MEVFPLWVVYVPKAIASMCLTAWAT
jgi:hypothetical protein